MAAKALGKIGQGARAAVPFLVKMLGDRVMIVRIAAAEALGEIGTADPAVLPALSRAMTDNFDENLAEQAAAALGALGEASIAFLVTALHNRDPDIRGRAARAFIQMGMAATAALPELERALTSEDDPDARQAIELATQDVRKYSIEAGSKADPDSNNEIDMP
jgi:HEAT repeat protein